MHPVQRAFDVGQAAGYSPVFREDAVTNALHHAVEPTVRMAHHVDIHVHTGTYVLELGFTIVCNDPPIASVDESEQRASRMSIGALRDIHVSYIGVKWRHHPGALEIE